MILAFAHDADLEMDDGADERAPGGAVTMSLCGWYDHAPPCPLAAHFTDVRRDGATTSLRILFATRPSEEGRVRALIGEALASGAFMGPDGVTARWRVQRHGPAALRSDDNDHAQRLIAGVAQD